MIALVQNEKCNQFLALEFYRRYEEAIKRALSQTTFQEREDLQQELYIKIFEKSRDLNFREEAPKFWEYFEKERNMV